MIIGIDLRSLKQFRIRAKRRSRHTFSSEEINTALIYITRQSNQKGINIDLRIPELSDFSYANVYLIRNELMIIPLRCYQDGAFRISLNRENSNLCTIKIGGQEYTNKIEEFFIRDRVELKVDKKACFDDEIDWHYYVIDLSGGIYDNQTNID